MKNQFEEQLKEQINCEKVKQRQYQNYIQKKLISIFTNRSMKVGTWGC